MVDVALAPDRVQAKPGKTMPPSDKANLARIRDNQRRSRARRREYVQELERKLRTCELEGVQASAEVQQAARRVAEENSKLRCLLRKHGLTDDLVESFLREGWLASPPPGDAASASPGGGSNVQRLLSLLGPRPPSFVDPGMSFDAMQSRAWEDDAPDLDGGTSHRVPALGPRPAQLKNAAAGLHAPETPAKKQPIAPSMPVRHVQRGTASVLQDLVALPQAPGMFDVHTPLVDMPPQGPGDYGQQASLRCHGRPYAYDAPGSHLCYHPSVLPSQLRPVPSQYVTTPDSVTSSESASMTAQIMSTMAVMDPHQLQRQLDHLPPARGHARDLVFDGY